MESKDLLVELRPDRPSYMILRGTYGNKIYKSFRMTRQGVRWRFWRPFNDIYVSAFESVLFVDETFGTQLREHAIRVSRERHVLRRVITQGGFQSADALQPKETPKHPDSSQPGRARRSSHGAQPRLSQRESSSGIGGSARLMTSRTSSRCSYQAIGISSMQRLVFYLP